jgi:hypothetical protein
LPEGKEERRELFLGQSERQFSVVRGRVFSFFLASKKGGDIFPKKCKGRKKDAQRLFFYPHKRRFTSFSDPPKEGASFPSGKEPPPRGRFFSVKEKAG